MLIYLGFSSVSIFLIWITVSDLLRRHRLARYERGKRLLRNAALWLTLDYTLNEQDAKTALLLLECAVREVESAELNFLVEEGLTV